MNLNIIFKDRVHIAHEVVFNNDIRRDIAGCFRFVLRSWLYYKDIDLKSFSTAVDIPFNKVHRNIGYGISTNRKIQYSLAKEACIFFGTSIEYIYAIAEQFLKNPLYNGISFDGDTVIFLTCFEFNAGY